MSSPTVATATPRAAYEVAPSRCLSLAGFKPVDEYPTRSPLAIADYLAPLVSGRSFCEIGTRNGDIMACLSHFASEVTAIELDKTYCKKLTQRGFRVLCKPVESVSAEQLPHAQVYFWWPMWSPDQNERWLRQLIGAHHTLRRNATAYIAHDTHW
jgi:hypothetical protein